MKSVGQTRFNHPEILNLPDPGPVGEGEVRVRMTLSPIGVAEVRALEGHRVMLVGQVVDENHPFIFGFAGVGVIEDPGRSGLQPMQRVVVTPFGTCGECAACLAEDETQCERGRSLAGIDVHCPGMMREILNVPARRVLPIPASITDEEGCYVSEVATAVHLLRRVKFAAGQSIAVSGCGRHGRLTILVAKAMGARSILGIDPSPVARDAALASGADECIAGPDGRSGYDVVIQCNALLDTIGPCCDLARVGGTIGLLGTPAKSQPDAAITRFTRRVIETERLLIASASKGTASFRVAIDLMKDGMNLDIRNSLTVSLDDAPEQFIKTLGEWPNGRPAFVRLEVA